MPAYVAKQPIDPTPEVPDDWDIGWPFPNGGIFPPGYEPTYTVTVSTDSTVYAATPGSTVTDPITVQCRTLDSGLATDDFLGGLCTLSAAVGSTVVPIRLDGGSTFLDSVSATVVTIDSSNFGADIAVEFEPDVSLDGQTMTLTATFTRTTSEYTPSGTAAIAIDITNFSLVFTVSPSTDERSSNLSFTIQAQDETGSVVTDRTDEITITLVGADASDKFTSPTPDAASYTANLVAGEYSITTQQITGGLTNQGAVTVTATADDWETGTSDAFGILIAAAAKTNFRAAGAPAANFSAARSVCDGTVIDGLNASAAVVDNNPNVNITRGGYSITGAIGLTYLRMTFVNGNNTTGADKNVYIVYSDTAPTTGVDILSWTIAATFAVPAGAAFDFDAEIDCSDALGTDTVYVSSIVAGDFDNINPVGLGENVIIVNSDLLIG